MWNARVAGGVPGMRQQAIPCCLAGQQACRPAQSCSKQPPMDPTPNLLPIGCCLNWQAIAAAWLGSRPAQSRSKQPPRMHGSIFLPQSHPPSLLHSLNPVYMNALPPGGQVLIVYALNEGWENSITVFPSL